MECYEQIVQLVCDAIGEVNERLEPEQALERSPDTVLLGDSGTLDSMGFVTLITAVEGNIDRIFKEEISLIDIVATAEHSQWTVATLARCIAELIGQRRAQMSPRT